MEIRALDPNDTVQSHRWYAALYAGQTAGREAPMVIAEASQVDSLRTNDTNHASDRRAYAAWDGEMCLGTSDVRMPRTDNAHIASIDISVPPDHRCGGVGSALYDHAIAVARDCGRTTIQDEICAGIDGGLADSPGGRFAMARGFVSVLRERRSVLEIPVPGSRVADLEAQARDTAAGYRAVSWCGAAPDEWVEQLAEMGTFMERDVPLGELDWDPVVITTERIRATEGRLIAQGFGPVTTLIVGPGGEPAAYTTILANGENATQDDTFVLRAHRGHRLGLLAKTVNLNQLTDHHPVVRFVQTWNAEVNDAMRAINERIGFRHVETMHAVELAL